MVTIGDITLEGAARAMAGNWRSWTCFVWDRRHDLRDPENWSIVYTNNRDSGLLDPGQHCPAQPMVDEQVRREYVLHLMC